MPIHHSQVKKAEKMGCTINDDEGDGVVVAFWPKRALKITGVSGSDTLAQMQAAQVIVDNGYRIEPNMHSPRLVYVENSDGQLLDGGIATTPVAAHKAIFISKDAKFTLPPAESEDLSGTAFDGVTDEDLGETLVPTPEGEPAPEPTAPKPAPQQVERSAAGVALNGAIAYKEGTPSGDCPFTSEDEEDEEEYARFIAWNDEWDAAADAAEEEEPKEGGSVVGSVYRTRYAEAGHPTHCGDWLALTLNNICGGKAQTDLELFENICSLNNVDTKKYRREGVGWQGRIRMTGRNLLAKQIFLQEGKLLVPPFVESEGFYKAPSDWMATQRFKMPKAQQ